MPRPEDVRPAKFPDPTVVYDDGEFAIAAGHWEGSDFCLAVRWNGQGSDPGYPKLFGNPTWLVLPATLTAPILAALLAANVVTVVKLIVSALLSTTVVGVRPEAIVTVFGKLNSK